MYLLSKFLKKLIKKGQVTVITADGKEHIFGGIASGPVLTVKMHDPALPRKLFLKPELVAGEAYMDGTLTIEQGTIREFFDLITGNMGWQPDNPLNAKNARVRRVKNFFYQYNTAAKSQRNVAHHYDLSNDLYEKFLDEEMHYSCAYFTEDNVDRNLERAQRDKADHIAEKLLLKPGQTVLDIGCGWGGMALHLHKHYGIDVTGVTLSKEQIGLAKARAAEREMDEHVKFLFQDYRAVEGPFNRIVSVGMFEHLGLPQFKEFFQKAYDLLDEDGVMLLHTIGRADGPGVTDDWTAKYIFPGGYVPSLSEIMRAIEKVGFYVTDIEVLRLHYAYTLEAWQERFQAHRDEIRDLHDERFCRMFENYLASAEYAFHNMGHVIFQIQMARKQEAVPLTRDYLMMQEAGH